MIKRSLRTHLVVPIAAVALLPLAVLTVLGYTVGTGETRAEVEARNLDLASAIGAEVSRFLEVPRRELQEVAVSVNRALARGEPISDVLARAREARPEFVALTVLSPGGFVIAASPPQPTLVGRDLGDLPSLILARSRGVNTFSPVTVEENGDPLVSLLLPEPSFTVVGELSLLPLGTLTRRHGGSPGREVALLDREGSAIFYPSQALARQAPPLKNLLPVTKILAGEAGTAEYEWSGRRFVGSAVRVPDTQWIVLVSERVESAYALLDRTRRFFILMLALCGGGAAVGAVLVLTQSLLRPVEALSQRAALVEKGEYERATDLRVSGPREIVGLAESFVSMAREVGAREEALRVSERDLRAVVDNPVVGLVRSRLDGTLLFVNAAFAKMMAAEGPDAILHLRAPDFYVEPHAREDMLEALRKEPVLNLEVRLRALDGTERTAVMSCQLQGETLLAQFVDITEKKREAEDRLRLESQLIHAQKMEAVGRLAGGVAHDFNNLLTAIVGYAEILKDAVPKNGYDRDNLDGILKAASRASHLTQSLLAYSRKQILRPRSLDLGEVVLAVEKFLRRLIGEDVVLEISLPGLPLVVVADPGQLEQVLVNLATNARDAMPTGGTLRIAADEVVLEEENAPKLGLPHGGPFVRILVSDTGEGMPESVRAKIFEPFFTTKPPGKGTGLGLSIVDGIVRQHGGHVSVESTAGKGTTFTILLERGPDLQENSSPAPSRSGPSGHEMILLAEDEVLVRTAVCRTLERAGYRVVEAEDGDEALSIFSASPERFGLCLLDVVMPKKNGRETACALKALRPRVPILLASGYAADALADRGQLTSEIELISKPLDPADLLRKVREMLDRAEDEAIPG